MNLNRRHFLQLSGLTSLGVVAGVNSLAQIFDVIPPSEQDFIPIVGIFPDPNSIKPGGIHLRWALPPAKGIPKEITIYRRKGSTKAASFLVRPGESGKSSFPSDFEQLKFSGPLKNFDLKGSRQERHYQKKAGSGGGVLKIIFSQKVSYCNISLGNVNPLTAKSYYENGTVCQEVVSERQPLTTKLAFKAPDGRSFSYIEIPVDFEFFYFLDFNGPKYLCESDGWKKIKEIDNDRDVSKRELFKRLDKDTRNYYIAHSKAFSKYEQLAKRYEGLLKILTEPTEEYFLKDPAYPSVKEIPTHLLNLKPKKGYDAKINLWNLLMFDGIDPNCATMLGLYFIDQDVKNATEIYDYKIEANYSSKTFKGKVCGVVLSVGGRYGAMPALQGPLSATQTGDTWWEFDQDFKETHFGKVRLSWPLVLNEEESFHLKYGEPVVYELTSDGLSKLIVPQSEQGQVYFMDQRVKIPEVQKAYQLKGVDLFGRSGNELVAKLKMLDKDTPPAPVKLSFVNFGDGGKGIQFRFEYGAYQYLTDPRIKKFSIFQKNDSVYTHNLKVKYNSFTILGQTFEGMQIFELSLSSSLGIAYQHLFFTADFAGKKLPAAKRRKFKVDRIDGNKVRFVSEIDFIPDQTGTILLEADYRDKALGWNLLTNFNTSFEPPVPFHLTSYVHSVKGASDSGAFAEEQVAKNGFSGTVKSFAHKEWDPGQDLFGSTAETRRTYTEIYLNRTLHEGGIFTGGSILIGSQRHTVIGQNAGKNSCCIFVEGHLSLDSGALVHLFLPRLDAGDERYIEGLIILNLSKEISLKDGGELLLRATKNYKIEKENREPKQVSEVTNVVAMLLSDSYGVDNGQQVLVRIGKKVSFLNSEKNAKESGFKGLYFKPYAVDLTNVIDGISLGVTEAFRTSHFAVTATDVADHESPLSVIAQFIKTRHKDEKPATVERPFPCNQPNASKAYLGLPNALGNSAFCLSWKGDTKLRYEVGRASDKSIITAHRLLWLRGLGHETDASDELNGVNLSTFTVANVKTGILEATYVAPASFDPDRYLGGRLFQVVSGKTNYFEVVYIKLVSAGQYRLGLRPALKGVVLSTVPCKIQKLPDYQAIHDNDDMLLRLANLKPTSEMPDLPDGLGAFSLVTGQPLRNTLRYLDEAPGQGKSRFFYKVRAVDASENRSLWSPASVPVWQMDTSEIEPLKIVKAVKRGGVADFQFFRSGSMSGILVFRSINNKEISYQDDKAHAKLTDINIPPIKYSNEEVVIGYVKGLSEQIASKKLKLVSIKKIKVDGVIEPNTNYFVPAKTILESGVVRNINSGLNESDKLKIKVSTNTVVFISEDFANEPIVSKAGVITFKSPFFITEVIGIYKRSEFNPNIFPANRQIAPNLFMNVSFIAHNDGRYTLSGLNPTLNNEPIVLLVKANRTSEIQGAFDTGNPLKFSNNGISLYESNTFTISGVYRYTDFNFATSPNFNQNVQNYGTTARLDSTNYTIAGLSSGLTDGEKLVIVISVTQGTEIKKHAVAFNPVNEEPIVVTNGIININWLLGIQEIRSIIKLSDESEEPFNYAFIGKTIFDSNKGTILFPNPHLSEGDALSVEFSNDSNSSVSFQHLTSLIEFKDEIPSDYDNVEYNFYAYRNLNQDAFPKMRIKSLPVIKSFIK